MWWLWMLAGIEAFFTILSLIGMPMLGIWAARVLKADKKVREKEPQGENPAEERDRPGGQPDRNKKTRSSRNMARKKIDHSEPLERDGKRLGSTHFYEDGSVRTFLNPHGKGRKYAKELSDGVRRTNDGAMKRDEYGMPLGLNDTQAAYRSGYLDAQKDQAAIWKKKHGKA